MSKLLTKPEVLAPAGDIERLRAAILFGADAVYLGGRSYGMRQGPSNFTQEELSIGCELAHKSGVKVYLTCNTLPTNREIDGFEEFIKSAYAASIDAMKPSLPQFIPRSFLFSLAASSAMFKIVPSPPMVTIMSQRVTASFIEPEIIALSVSSLGTLSVKIIPHPSPLKSLEAFFVSSHAWGFSRFGYIKTLSI